MVMATGEGGAKHRQPTSRCSARPRRAVVAVVVMAALMTAGRAEAKAKAPPGTKLHGCFAGTQGFGPLAVPTGLRGKAASHKLQP